MRASFGETPVVLDVGANVGYFALATFRKYPRAKVVSFEPHPFCVAALRQERARFARYDWSVDPVALADRSGTGELKADLLDDYSSISSIGPRSVASHGRHHEIALRTLGDALDAHGLAWVDLAKFDCEGGEYPALFGASDEALGRVRALSLETHKDTTPGYTREALEAYLRERGFRTRKATESRDADMLFAWREGT